MSTTEETTAGAGAAAERPESRVYEVSYLLVPSLDEAGRSSAVDALRAHVEGKGGTIISEVYPELIELSYPMDHITAGKRTSVRSAFFGWMFVELDPGEAPTVKSAVEGEGSVIRSLLVQTSRTQAETPTHYSFGRFAPTAETVEVTAPMPPADEPKEEVVEEEVDKAIDELVGGGDDEGVRETAPAAVTPAGEAPDTAAHTDTGAETTTDASPAPEAASEEPAGADAPKEDTK